MAGRPNVQPFLLPSSCCCCLCRCSCLSFLFVIPEGDLLLPLPLPLGLSVGLQPHEKKPRRRRPRSAEGRSEARRAQRPDYCRCLSLQDHVKPKIPQLKESKRNKPADSPPAPLHNQCRARRRPHRLFLLKPPNSFVDNNLDATPLLSIFCRHLPLANATNEKRSAQIPPRGGTP